MINAFRAVCMAMGNFIIRRIPNCCDFHVENERLAGQWMVGVYVDVKAANFQHRNLNRTLFGLQTQELARL